MKALSWAILLVGVASINCTTALSGPYRAHKFNLLDVIINDQGCYGTVVDYYDHVIIDEMRYKVKDFYCGGREYYFAIVPEKGFRLK